MNNDGTLSLVLFLININTEHCWTGLDTAVLQSENSGHSGQVKTLRVGCDLDGLLQLVEEVGRDVPVVVDQGPDISLADLVPRLHRQLHPGSQVQLILGAESSTAEISSLVHSHWLCSDWWRSWYSLMLLSRSPK